jgi:hypothetical protein
MESEFEVIRFRGIVGPAAYGIQITQDALIPKLYWRIRTPFTYLAQRLIAAVDSRCSQHEKDQDASVFVIVARMR